jgi:hypothetical protein
MDSLVMAAARALRAGDPLGALKRVALREDPPALALRGIAMAQLGELTRASQLLRRATRLFSPTEELERARCLTAEAEVALAARDLSRPAGALEEARRIFTAHGDHQNALHARLVQLRRSLLLGEVKEADRALSGLDLRAAGPVAAASAALLAFELAVRRGRTGPAAAALARAQEAAERSAIPALCAEVERAGRALALPAGRLVAGGAERSLVLAEVEELLGSPRLVVDACRRVVRRQHRLVSFARRPVLFALLRALAEAWPDSAPRERLIEQAFGARRVNASHRARLRVEIGRLRLPLRPLAAIEASPSGFALVSRQVGEVVVLAPPIESPDAAVLALLSDGEAWSTSALALALGSSQRTVQRALRQLEADGRVREMGRGRAQRWLSAPVTGFTTALLLPAGLPVG